MAAKQRLAWLAAILVVGAGVSTLLRPPSERMLLVRARLAVPAPQYGGGNYQWLSNSELLLERDWSDTAIPQSGFSRRNLATGVRTYEPALNALMFSINSTLSQFMKARPGRRQ